MLALTQKRFPLASPNVMEALMVIPLIIRNDFELRNRLINLPGPLPQFLHPCLENGDILVPCLTGAPPGFDGPVSHDWRAIQGQLWTWTVPVDFNSSIYGHKAKNIILRGMGLQTFCQYVIHHIHVLFLIKELIRAPDLFRFVGSLW